jgi:hypothetical protein
MGMKRVDGDTRDVARQPMGSRKRVEGLGRVGHGWQRRTRKLRVAHCNCLVTIYVFPEMKLLFPKHNYNVMSPTPVPTLIFL